MDVGFVDRASGSRLETQNLKSPKIASQKDLTPNPTSRVPSGQNAVRFQNSLFDRVALRSSEHVELRGLFEGADLRALSVP